VAGVSVGAGVEGPPIATLDSSTHPLSSGWYANNSPALEWSADDTTGIIGYSYVIDQLPDTVADETSEGDATSVSYADLADGVWYFHVCAENGSGLWGPTLTRVVRIDTRPARFSWQGMSPKLLYRTEPVRLSLSITDLSGTIRVTYRVFDAWGGRVARRGGIAFTPGLRSLSVSTVYANGRPFLSGLYRVRLRLVDAAGNARVTGAVNFRDYRPARARVWSHVSGAGRRVALTFDDGYDATAWASILSVLRARGVRATFFVNGCHVAEHPDLARRTAALGNAIGAHTWSHNLTTLQTRQEIVDELHREIAQWWRVARVTPVPYFRPPYGGYDGETLSVAGSLGFARVILWDVDPSDWAGAGSSAIVHRVLSHAHPGSIVLLHCTRETAGALPAIIAGLRARGYSAVTLPALMHAAGYR
jgi:peptidoglycan-N-acetylglucosamine deacetylase